MQKTYWNAYCHKLGYVPRHHRNKSEYIESSTDYTDDIRSKKKSKIPVPHSDKFSSDKHQKHGGILFREKGDKAHGVGVSSSESTSPMFQNMRDNDLQTNMTTTHANGISQKDFSGQKSLLVSALKVRHSDCPPNQNAMQVVTRDASSMASQATSKLLERHEKLEVGSFDLHYVVTGTRSSVSSSCSDYANSQEEVHNLREQIVNMKET